MTKLASPAPVRSRLPTRWCLLAAALGGLAACRASGLSPRSGPAMTVVAQTAAEPFSSICRLEVRRRQVNGLVITDHETVSTATLIDARHLLTAAHSVSSLPHMPVRARTMECGLDGERAVWSRSEALRRVDLRVVPEFEGSAADDYAVVSVGRGAPFRPAFRLPRAGEAVLRPGDTVHVAGYALDRREYDGQRLYHGAGVVLATSRDSTVFIYDVPTRGGMSGSPVWVVRRAANGRMDYIIVGVHVGRHSIDRRLWALARRVRGDALTNVQEWIATDSLPR